MKTNDLVKLAFIYEQKCLQNLISLAKIRKMPDGKYHVLSEKGKNLGAYTSREKAESRLKQVEFFKHLDKSHADDVKIIDLTDLDEFALSAIMRKLRQKASPEQARQFLMIFKKQFDKAVKNNIHKPERIALQNAVLKFHKLFPIKIDKKVIKVK